MLLRACDLSFAYKKGKDILKNVSFTVDTDTPTALIAPSGSGKTTLCHILAGYLKPNLGQALFDDNDVYYIKGYHPVQMIWQHPEQAFNPRLRLRVSIAEGDEIDLRLIDALEIRCDWLNRFPNELSGGELQRLCIARALGKSTKFLIADEITAMLDMIAQANIWKFLFEETMRRKIGLLMVTHNMALAEKCDVVNTLFNL